MSERKHKLMGEWKFTDKISYEVLDLDTPVEEWETPPPLTIEGELSIVFPDGREIKNPSAEEFKEWVKGTQIPYYAESES